VADILSTGLNYRLLVQKNGIKEGHEEYPYLKYLFTRLQEQSSEPTLLGYCSKVLISLVKKTPEVKIK
jgi:hypothetical protein